MGQAGADDVTAFEGGDRYPGLPGGEDMLDDGSGMASDSRKNSVQVPRSVFSRSEQPKPFAGGRLDDVIIPADLTAAPPPRFNPFEAPVAGNRGRS